MAVNIKSTKNVAVNGVKLVIYGGSGVGKTSLAKNVPDSIILSAEQGLLSLQDYDIPYIETNTLADINDAFKFLKDDTKYETIFLDSVTEIAEAVLTKHKDDPELKDGRQAYMKLAESMGAMIRHFRDLKGKNIVMIAKMKRVEDESSGIVTFTPWMPGQVLPHGLPYLVDEVFAMQIDRKGERFLQTNADRKFPCKDRSGRLEAKEQPDLAAIFKKITTKHKPETKEE